MEIYALLVRVREKKPLVHHLTNWVTIYECAAITRAFGALPVMAHAPEEVAEMSSIASALVLNIGTLTTELVDAMLIAGKPANAKGIPVILDAVGAGATKMRTEKAKEIMKKVKVAVVKGNRSEIAVLAGVDAQTHGVEAGNVSGELGAIALGFAKSSNSIVVITGKRDVVASPSGKLFYVDNGHEMMGKVVGTGCMAASVIGAFCAVAGSEKEHAEASAAALSCYGIAGELAAKKAKTPMAFKNELIDAASSLSAEAVGKMARVVENGKN